LCILNCRSIHSCNKQTGTQRKVILSGSLTPMDLRVYDPARQPRTPTSLCQENNGGCSHLCLAAPYAPGYSCACPTGTKLLNSSTCADGELPICKDPFHLCVVRRVYYLKISHWTTDLYLSDSMRKIWLWSGSTINTYFTNCVWPLLKVAFDDFWAFRLQSWG
jgi:hypothetical protein